MSRRYGEHQRGDACWRCGVMINSRKKDRTQAYVLSWQYKQKLFLPCNLWLGSNEPCVKEVACIYEQSLLLALLEGDHSAFEKLVALYRRPAVLFALRLTRDTASAEDAVQEAFAYLWVHRGRIRTDASLKPLLFTLVRRRCMDWFRYWHRLTSLDSEVDWDDYAPERVYAQEKALALYDALNNLQPADARLLHLLDLEGFTQREVAVIMGKTEGAIKTAHHRAKERLKQHLKKEDNS